jgi:hypothetical protein
MARIDGASMGKTVNDLLGDRRCGGCWVKSERHTVADMMSSVIDILSRTFVPQLQSITPHAGLVEFAILLG